MRLLGRGPNVYVMDTNTATAPNTVAYRGVVHDATVIRETLEQFPGLPLEAKAALDARLEDLEAKAAELIAEHAARRVAHFTGYVA